MFSVNVPELGYDSLIFNNLISHLYNRWIRESVFFTTSWLFSCNYNKWL